MSGNIEAGDINQACCVSSVIAQNPYGFHGGRNAYTSTYLTGRDVKNATAPPLPTLQAQTLSLFHTLIVLDPHCSTTVATLPLVGQQTSSAIAKISTTCNTISYAKKTIIASITTYTKNLGMGTLSHIQFQVIGVEGDVIRLYVTAIFNPIVVRHFVAK